LFCGIILDWFSDDIRHSYNWFKILYSAIIDAVWLLAGILIWIPKGGIRESWGKKEFAIETLKHLQDNNIDVCISTHCNKYLEELSLYAKYIIYDYNNELVVVKDFLDNIDLIDDSCNINGSVDNFFTFDYSGDSPVASRFIPGPEHSKPALILLRNGVQVAHSNQYKWVIYLEYDLPIPIGGYKKFIEDKISILENNNKECFYYISNLTYNQYLWGGCFICKTNKLFSSKKSKKLKFYDFPTKILVDNSKDKKIEDILKKKFMNSR